MRLSRAEKRKHKKKLLRKKRRTQIAIARQQHKQNPQVQLEQERALEEWKEQINKEAQERARWEEREKEYEKRSQALRKELEQITAKQRQKEKRKRSSSKGQNNNETPKNKEKNTFNSNKLNQINQVQFNSSISAADSNTMNSGTNQCPLFSSTGVCRYGAKCNYFHVHPSSGTVLVFPGMYGGMGTFRCWDIDSDNAYLENDETEIKNQFREFYFDVIREFMKYGDVKVFQVARNHALHLRGNVYVQFSNDREAKQCLEAMNGRYYAQKQLFGYFNPTENWKTILCISNNCQGITRCNFVHPFRNPKGDLLAPQLKSITSPRHHKSKSSKETTPYKTYHRSHRHEPYSHSYTSRKHHKNKRKDRHRQRNRRTDRNSSLHRKSHYIKSNRDRSKVSRQ